MGDGFIRVPMVIHQERYVYSGTTKKAVQLDGLLLQPMCLLLHCIHYGEGIIKQPSDRLTVVDTEAFSPT